MVSLNHRTASRAIYGEVGGGEGFVSLFVFCLVGWFAWGSCLFVRVGEGGRGVMQQAVHRVNTWLSTAAPRLAPYHSDRYGTRIAGADGGVFTSLPYAYTCCWLNCTHVMIARFLPFHELVRVLCDQYMRSPVLLEHMLDETKSDAELNVLGVFFCEVGVWCCPWFVMYSGRGT